jgi:hypothetical protein
MIKVSKPATAPKNFRERGKQETTKLKTAYSRNPGDYISGAKKFEFKSSIFGAKSVKSALKKAHKDKCCFCESLVTVVAYGDVEHFRPKGRFRQIASQDLQRPGYYWEAYNWDNLYFSCQSVISGRRRTCILWRLPAPAPATTRINWPTKNHYL